jgi:hypothetical protein
VVLGVVGCGGECFMKKKELHKEIWELNFGLGELREQCDRLFIEREKALRQRDEARKLAEKFREGGGSCDEEFPWEREVIYECD